MLVWSLYYTPEYTVYKAHSQNMKIPNAKLLKKIVYSFKAFDILKTWNKRLVECLSNVTFPNIWQTHCVTYLETF